MNNPLNKPQREIHIPINSATCQLCGIKLILEENTPVLPVAKEKGWKYQESTQRYLCPNCSKPKHPFNIFYSNFNDLTLKEDQGQFIDTFDAVTGNIYVWKLEVNGISPNWKLHKTLTPF